MHVLHGSIYNFFFTECLLHVNVQGVLERARAIKQQGNDFFKQQKYEEAIRCYQEAIKVCPVEKKEDVAIFHQNIGAVYDQMVRNCVEGGVDKRERGRGREGGGGRRKG